MKMITDKKQTLKEALQDFCLDQQENIPWIIKLIENPVSPIALPGKISLYNHDCLHILLDRKVSSSDEAFVIGFTMGNDPNTRPWHLKIFKFFSSYLYPHPYKFAPQDFYALDLGFKYGKSLPARFNRIDFGKYKDVSIGFLRQILGINEEYLFKLKLIENEYKHQYLMNIKNRKKKKIKLLKLNALKFSSSIFALCGGLMLALNTSWSGYGFIFLACSSSQMLIASVIEFNKIMIFYSAILLACVDLLGVYCWLFASS